MNNVYIIGPISGHYNLVFSDQSEASGLGKLVLIPQMKFSQFLIAIKLFLKTEPTFTFEDEVVKQRTIMIKAQVAVEDFQKKLEDFFSHLTAQPPTLTDVKSATY